METQTIDQQLLEDNKATIKELIENGENGDGTGEYPGRKVLLESIKSRTGVDLYQVFLREGGGVKKVNWRKFMEATRKLSREVLREAISEPTQTAIIRAGVNLVADEWYQLVPTDFERCFQVASSKYYEELYAPLHRGGAPVRLMEEEPFRMTDLKGLDIKIRNWKFMAGIPIARELFEDDQTGQVSARVQDIAANQKLLQENWAMQRWIGTAATAQVGSDTIPASETYSGGVYLTNLSAGPQGTVSNRLTTYSSFSELNLQALDVLAMNMLDLNGNKILVNPNLLLNGTAIKFSAEILVSNANAYYASTVPSQLVNTGGKGTTTNIGTAFAKNVMAGRYEAVTNRFLPSTAYGIMEKGKGLVVQLRVPIELTMEDPNAGESFRRDAFIWRSRSRFNADWIDPRFSFLGDDGTV
jgi:hypothetical protein